MIVKLDKYGWTLVDFKYVKVGEGITTLGKMAFVLMNIQFSNMSQKDNP